MSRKKGKTVLVHKKVKSGTAVKMPKARNPHAVAAHFRNSAGSMGDEKKKRSKKCCRGNQMKKFGL